MIVVKRLAVNDRGMMTYCSVPEELQGMGRCNHVFHQLDGETEVQFVERLNDLESELGSSTPGLQANALFRDGGDFLNADGQQTITTSQYKISDEEAQNMHRFLGPKDLRDESFDEGYIELDEAVWNQMDLASYSERFGTTPGQLRSVLDGRSSIVYSTTDEEKYPVGKIVTNETAEVLADLESGEVLAGSGLECLNAAAESQGFEATKRVYVLPYYMRRGVNDIDSDLTSAYISLVRKKRDPNLYQLSYDRLVDNSGLDSESANYVRGYRTKGLSDEFVGKSGVFRAQLSGSNVPYSGRAVIGVTTDIKHGELAIPPYQAATLFEPTLRDQLQQEGFTNEQIESQLDEWKSMEIDPTVYSELDDRLRRADVRVLMGRQPSLHYSSLLSFKPVVRAFDGEETGAVRSSGIDVPAVGGPRIGRKVRARSTIALRPEYFRGLGADIDGDACHIEGLNDIRAARAADRSMSPSNPVNYTSSTNRARSDILPSKDALWGLANILKRRS